MYKIYKRKVFEPGKPAYVALYPAGCTDGLEYTTWSFPDIILANAVAAIASVAYLEGSIETGNKLADSFEKTFLQQCPIQP